MGRTGTGGLLGLDVIGSGGKQFVETTPVTTPFDEVRITFAGVADALKSIQLAGVYTRPDSNGDGIPDCAETTTDPGGSIDVISVTEHICGDRPSRYRYKAERTVTAICCAVTMWLRIMK